jgi:alpha-beta hydrolase superfamily lysophospholipase
MLRTRFKKDIVAEFLPPRQARGKLPRKGRRAHGKKIEVDGVKVVILCAGAPSVPSLRPLMEFLSKKGFWAFVPRYRGSWESSGRFLKISLERDILDVIDELPRGFTDLASGVRYRVKPKSIYLLASSFGGPAGILASRDPRVTKVVAFSPVIDWRAPSKAEPFGWFEKYVREAFGEAYRVGEREWAKLRSGKFYNPAMHADEIDGRKLLIFHAKDDESVGWRPVAKFAKRVGARMKLYKRGGHLRMNFFMRPAVWRQVKKFLHSAYIREHFSVRVNPRFAKQTT